MENYYPPVGFHFEVRFENLAVTSKKLDAHFQSVTGLTVEFETEIFKEGGEIRFEHVLPVRIKYPNLVLKRGMLLDSGVIDWCKDAFQNMIFLPTDLSVILKNEKHEPLRTWKIIGAWPKKWSVTDFNAEASSLVVETLELQYRFFDVL